MVGPWCEERVRWSTGGRSLIDGPRPGDRVALHWDWLCDVVTDEQATRIETLEARQRAELGPIRRPFGSESGHDPARLSARLIGSAPRRGAGAGHVRARDVVDVRGLELEPFRHRPPEPSTASGSPTVCHW